MIKKDKKILYITKDDFPWDIRTDKICSGLGDSYNVRILCRKQKHSTSFESFKNYSIKRFGYLNIFNVLTFPLSLNPFWKSAIEKEIREFNPNLVIVREMHLAYAVGKIGKKYNIPVIMDMAENYPAAIKLWKKYNNNWFKRWLFHTYKLADKIEVKSLKYMKGIITVCDEQHKRVQSLCSHKLDFVTIYNTPEKQTFSRKYDLINNKITFGHHGYLTSEKKIDTLIKSFSLLCDLYYNSKNVYDIKDIDFQLLIAGSGDCLDDLLLLANRSKYIDRITFLGNYQYEKLDSILERIDVGVIPYQVNDFNNYTIHNKIFDFFAKGIPVIVSEAIPNANVVKKTKSGLISNCDKIDELTHSMFEIIGEKYKFYSDNAFYAYEHTYNWTKDKNHLIDFIEKFVDVDSF